MNELYDFGQLARARRRIVGKVVVSGALFTDRRTMRLAKILGIDRVAAAGAIISLWIWALDNGEQRIGPADLGEDFGMYAADVTGLNLDSLAITKALTASGWLLYTGDIGEDEDDAKWFIRAWDDDGPISLLRETDPNE